jgi:dihydropteroate synthase
MSLVQQLLGRVTPCVMGIINCSPNSFYGAVVDNDQALTLAAQMIAEGAAMIDVGGEATNPKVDLQVDGPSLQQEIDRVVPVIEAIKQRFDVMVSVDTSQPQVMLAAINAGVDMINDQRALTFPGALDIVSQHNVLVCLMHFFNERVPASSSPQVMFDTIVKDLSAAIERCLAAGIPLTRLIADPGFGQGHYGKNTQENFYLLSQLPQFKTALHDLPLLVGWSRKSMIGDVLQSPVAERLYGSVAAATLCAFLGADIIRVHDVKATVDAIKVVKALQAATTEVDAAVTMKD